MSERILIVEDDLSLSEIMTDFFIANDYEVRKVSSGSMAIGIIGEEKFDIILLDVNLPDMDGFEICRYIREYTTVNVPILFITARISEIDKLNGYACGGDDYITKPFSLLVLHAKIRAILNRIGSHESLIQEGSLTINKETHMISANGNCTQLAPKEYELLVFLTENKGRLFTREALLTRLWGYDYEGSERVVDDHIRKLRKRLGSCSSYIQTVRGGGYRFSSDGGKRL